VRGSGRVRLPAQVVRKRPPARSEQLMLERRRRGGTVDVPERPAQGADVRQPAALGAGQPVMDQRLCLPDAHPLDRHRHDDAGEARSRLTSHQRVHRLCRSGELGGEPGQTRRRTRGRGVATELGAEFRIDEQPLDQLTGSHVLLITG